MNNFKGSKFDSVGVDEDGKGIITISDNIEHWKVEQKKEIHIKNSMSLRTILNYSKMGEVI